MLNPLIINVYVPGLISAEGLNVIVDNLPLKYNGVKLIPPSYAVINFKFYTFCFKQF